jgi:hypothetical protein
LRESSLLAWNEIHLIVAIKLLAAVQAEEGGLGLGQGRGVRKGAACQPRSNMQQFEELSQKIVTCKDSGEHE